MKRFFKEYNISLSARETPIICLNPKARLPTNNAYAWLKQPRRWALVPHAMTQPVDHHDLQKSNRDLHISGGFRVMPLSDFSKRTMFDEERREKMVELYVKIDQTKSMVLNNAYEPVTLIVEATLGTPFLSMTNNIQYPGSATPGSLGTWNEYEFFPALANVNGIRRWSLLTV